MKIFKKSVCAVLLIALIACTLLVGCGKSGYSITFDLNYDGAPAATVVSVEEGSRVTPPANPEREGYTFLGWYTDKSCATEAPLSRVVSENATYYAGWEQTGAKVTFDLNYEGSENTSQIVELGGKATRPQNPTREGSYLFLGWYTVSTCDCTDEELHTFDFDSTITESVTVYARWQEVDGDIVNVTYNWNYDGAPDGGVCEVYQMEKNSRFPGKVNPVTGIEREGYYLVGWYYEASCETAVVWRNKVSDNTNIYAKWLKVNTFEAEYVDVTDLKGFGFSGNADGVNMISEGSKEFASNGYYLGWLYNPQLQINFEIDCEEDISDAWLVLRLSAEFADITLTSSDFTILVDGTKNSQGKYEGAINQYIAYDSIKFENVPSVSSDDRRPFQNYTITEKLSLTKGKHVITLTINNTERPLGDQGTIDAAAPMIDTLYIYTESTAVNWAEGFPMTDNLAGK